MDNGSSINYDFGSKRQWRKWVWNRINENIKHDRKNKVVLYLIGSEPNDIKIATKKGYSHANLLGVDLNHKNVENLRKAGGFGIQCDICNLLNAWSNDIMIDAVIADFCCGITKQVVYFLESFMTSKGIHKETVLAVNLLRGRDVFTNEFRNQKHYNGTKHRGELFLGLFRTKLLSGIEADELRCNISYLNRTGKLESFTKKINKMMNPKFITYRSIHGGVYFDSVVFKPLLEQCNESTLLHTEDDLRSILKTKKRLTAWKAVRSMRMAA